LILVLQALGKKMGCEPFLFAELLGTADFPTKDDTSDINVNLKFIELRVDLLPKEHIILRALNVLQSKVTMADITSAKDLQEFFTVSQMQTFGTFRVLYQNSQRYICNIGIAFKLWNKKL
jgi:hypothetical protein